MSCSTIKLKSHILLTCENFMFYEGKKILLQTMVVVGGGGGGGPRPPRAPCPPFSTALCLYELFVFFVCSVSNSM